MEECNLAEKKQPIVIDVRSLNLQRVNIAGEQNWDLAKATKEQLDNHYKKYGLNERHQYNDELFDETFFLTHNNITDKSSPYKTYLNDIRLSKSKKADELIANIPNCNKDFVLVSHNSKINGATHSLYILANFLKNKGYTIIILDIEENKEELYKKYNLTADDFVFYYNDPTILYWACSKIKSSKIIVNSISSIIAETVRWLDRSKLLLFSREVKMDYMRHSCYEPDVVITQMISDSYESKPIIQTPICPLFLQERIYEKYEEEAIIEGLDQNKITIGMCGSLTRIKNHYLFLEVARHLTQYNFIWIGGEKLDTDLSNVFHVAGTTNPFKYYKLFDYFVLFSDREPFGNVILENLLLNKKVLTFKKNVYFDFNHFLTRDNYFEFEGNITLDNAIKHITEVAITKQANKGYINSPSNRYVTKYFSDYNSEFLDLLKVPTVHLNRIKNLTDTQDVYVKCPMGFCNQLRLLMAGSYLVTNGFIKSYTQEWILNDHNNVDFSLYFESFPGVTLEPIEERVAIKSNNVINTTCFSRMIRFFTNNKINPDQAFREIAYFIKLKEDFKTKIDIFFEEWDLKNALGLHLRETDKVEMYPEKNITRTIEEIISLCAEYNKVYLATDNKETQDLVKKHLGKKIVVYSDMSTEQLVNSLRYTSSDHTVADFMLLQKCKKFVGTDMSSFSTLVKYIRNAPSDGELKINL